MIILIHYSSIRANKWTGNRIHLQVSVLMTAISRWKDYINLLPIYSHQCQYYTAGAVDDNDILYILNRELVFNLKRSNVLWLTRRWMCFFSFSRFFGRALTLFWEKKKRSDRQANGNKTGRLIALSIIPP